MSKISITTLGSLIEFQRGYDLPKTSFVEGDVPVISSNGILGYHNEYKVKGPGITIGRSGTVGLPHYIEENFYPHNTSLFIKDFKGNNPKYIYYLLKTLGLNDRGSGSGVPTMNRNHLHPLKVRAYLNPIYQEGIANVLTSIDSKIALNNRINAELEAMAKTVYDYWFVQFDFPFDFVQGKPSAEGKPYKSSGGKMVWSEELKREVPEGWEIGTLSDLGDIVGGSTPPREVAGYFCNNGTAWITPKDLSLIQGNKFITKGELDVSESGIKAASLNIMPKGTILLSSRAPIGYLAISRDEVTTNQGFKSFVPNKGYSTEYVYYSIKNMIPTIENNAVGSTFKEVSASTLKSIKVCLAQKEIVEAYNKKVSAIFNRQNLLEQENQQLSLLRDWLLPMLMNGQVKVGGEEEEGLMAAEPEEEYGE